MNKIPLENNYQGYVWFSDKTIPDLFENEPLTGKINLEPSNPFVIEAQLFDKENQRSFSIKYVDNEYIISEFCLDELEKKYGKYSREKQFLGNRMNDNTLCFKEFWKSEVDAFCDNMNVLKPAEFVFVGFKQKED